MARGRQPSPWPTPPAWFVHSPVLACIELRESGDGRASSNLYGMLDGWAAAGGRGTAASASPAEQLYRAWLLYSRFGWSPWRPYDGC